MRRHEIKDEDFERIKDMLPGQAGDPGVTAKDNRLFRACRQFLGKLRRIGYRNRIMIDAT